MRIRERHKHTERPSQKERRAQRERESGRHNERERETSKWFWWLMDSSERRCVASVR